MVFSNAVDTSLVGQTGTGAFVGSVGPTLSLPVANNINFGYTTTLTSASPVVLTASSNYQQFFTGSTAQTLTLPVASTMALGQSYLVVNLSTMSVTIQSSGGNTVATVPGGDSQTVTCILTSGTSAASWSAQEAIASGVTSITGTANQVIASAATGAVTLSLPQSIGTSSNVTFGSITAPIVGVTDGSDAAAGNVGEVVIATVGNTTTGLTETTTKNVTSVSLTAGDWNVYGYLVFSGNDATTMNICEGGLTTTSAVLPTIRSQIYVANTTMGNVGSINYPTPTLRVSISGTTTVYLTAQADFAVNTAGVGGQIFARRVR